MFRLSSIVGLQRVGSLYHKRQFYEILLNQWYLILSAFLDEIDCFWNHEFLVLQAAVLMVSLLDIPEIITCHFWIVWMIVYKCYVYVMSIGEYIIIFTIYLFIYTAIHYMYTSNSFPKNPFLWWNFQWKFRKNCLMNSLDMALFFPPQFVMGFLDKELMKV